MNVNKMKTFYPAFISVAFLIFTPSIFAQPSTPVPTAFISVISQHPGLPVLIDGQEAGFTPLQYWPLPPGKHEIAVKRARPESWLDFDWAEICSLQAGDTLNFVARFQRGYSINSTPFGAEVLVNDILQGTTPHIVRLPERETAHVEIRQAGYQSEHLQVGEAPGTVAEIRLYNVELKSEQNLPLIQEVEKTRRGFRLHRHRRLSLAAAGLSLASGITAILLKDKADHFYDQYLTASLPEKRERFYQRTEDYDRYSGIATAVFEASFAVSFYYFIKSTAE